MPKCAEFIASIQLYGLFKTLYIQVRMHLEVTHVHCDCSRNEAKRKKLHFLGDYSCSDHVFTTFTALLNISRL